MDIERIGRFRNQLGESCVWSEQEQALYWVDVRVGQVFRFDHGTGAVETIDLPEMVGSLALRKSGGVIVAMQTGIAALNWETRRLMPLARPEAGSPDRRFNDGRCDRKGRFWVGTMDDVARGPTGTLYRLDNERRLQPVIERITIPNSLAWSPEGDVMYLSDTPSHTIRRYDFDIESGIPSAGRRFATTSNGAEPDGSTVDAEGCLWNAEYNGWRITRYDPAGKIDRVIDLPIQRPTCCAFGGPHLTTLFVTTAAQRLSESELDEQPLAGGLLAIDVGIKGLAEPAYIG